MQIRSIIEENTIRQAVKILTEGGMVIYPTETCYGIAVDATNYDAVTKLLKYKGDRYRQVAIAVVDRAMAEKYVNLNDIARNLYKNFLPGPITVISQSRHAVDERLESSSGTLGIRIPKYDFALKLIEALGKPITATSANTSGRKEPYSLQDWQKYTTAGKQTMIDLFCDGGHLKERPTSTVVDTTLNDPAVLRQGEIVVPDSADQSFVSGSPETTVELGQTILKRHLNLLHRFPLLIALQGELGVGKTQITKGFARELGIADTVNSPTYTLMHEYPFIHAKYEGTFYHIDTWRLSDMTELDSTLRVATVLKPGNIVVMEWAGKAKECLEGHQNDTAILVIDIKEKDDRTRLIKYSLSTPEWT